MRNTVLLIAKMLRNKLSEGEENVTNLQTERSLEYLPKFFEKIFIAKDTLQVLIKENVGKEPDEFTRKIIDFLEKASSPNGWLINRIIWEKITVEEIVTWFEKNEKEEHHLSFFKILEDLKAYNGWDDKKTIEKIFVHPFITDNYKILCAIINEHE